MGSQQVDRTEEEDGETRKRNERKIAHHLDDSMLARSTSQIELSVRVPDEAGKGQIHQPHATSDETSRTERTRVYRGRWR